MLCKEIITVCFEIHIKHRNAHCWQNEEFSNVKPGGKISDHWALNGVSRLEKEAFPEKVQLVL